MRSGDRFFHSNYLLIAFAEFIVLVLQMSFEPLVQSLNIENLIQLFTAVLLERRVLLRANK